MATPTGRWKPEESSDLIELRRMLRGAGIFHSVETHPQGVTRIWIGNEYFEFGPKGELWKITNAGGQDDEESTVPTGITPPPLEKGTDG